MCSVPTFYPLLTMSQVSRPVSTTVRGTLKVTLRWRGTRLEPQFPSPFGVPLEYHTTLPLCDTGIPPPFALLVSCDAAHKPFHDTGRWATEKQTRCVGRRTGTSRCMILDARRCVTSDSLHDGSLPGRNESTALKLRILPKDTVRTRMLPNELTVVPLLQESNIDLPHLFESRHKPSGLRHRTRRLHRQEQYDNLDDLQTPGG